MAKEKAPKKQFIVGNKEEGADFSPEEIEALTYKIALWFGKPECDRNYDDPVQSAQQKIRECLLAETDSGDPWRNCPNEFADRVKAKCAYDMREDRGIPSKRVKHPDAVRALDKKAQEAAKEGQAQNLLDSMFDQESYRKEIEHKILTAFPELDNPAHMPNVRSLSLYHAQREVIDRQLSMGVTDGKRIQLLEGLKNIEVMADQTMKRLGIHFDQVRKKISDKGASTVADLAAMVSDDDGYKKREKVWALQLALQLWWMSEHYNGRKSGPQLHPFEIWHMTRSRPIDFTCRCGVKTKLIEGFEPQELREFLMKEGVLIEEPVVPGLIAREDILGLTTADLAEEATTTQDGNYGGTEEGDAVGAGSPTT